MASTPSTNGEIKRKTEVVGIFPNEDAIIRLIRVILLEQNDEWAVQCARYMTLETITSKAAAIPRRRYDSSVGVSVIDALPPADGS